MTSIKFTALSWVGVLVCLAFPACSPQAGTTPEVAEYMGSWRDFHQDCLMVEIASDHILIQQNYQPRFRKPGHWTDHKFFCLPTDGSTGELVVARELPNEDLELQMKYFDPHDASVLLCTKTSRGVNEFRPYPTTGTPGLVVTYPPPKGLFRVGMLKADIDYLPWASTSVDLPEDHGDNENADLVPNIYHYHSDNPALPELRVTVLKGRVIDVAGGAESTGDAPYVLPTPPPAQASSNSWVWTILDLLFKK